MKFIYRGMVLSAALAAFAFASPATAADPHNATLEQEDQKIFADVQSPWDSDNNGGHLGGDLCRW